MTFPEVERLAETRPRLGQGVTRTSEDQPAGNPALGQNATRKGIQVSRSCRTLQSNRFGWELRRAAWVGWRSGVEQSKILCCPGSCRPPFEPAKGGAASSGIVHAKSKAGAAPHSYIGLLRALGPRVGRVSAKIPTSRKGREKWGTRHGPRLILSPRSNVWVRGSHPCKERKDGAPSVEMVHTEMIKGGPPARSRP